MRWLWTLALLVVSALTSSNTSAASFDCAHARTPAEKLICSDPELSRADDEMSAAYEKARRALAPAEVGELVRSQRSWLEYRNYVCSGDPGEKGCRNAYARRRRELDEWPNRGHTVTFDASEQSKRVCGALLERSNLRVSPGDSDYYEPITALVPEGLRQLDWERLNTEQFAAVQIGHANFDFLNQGTPTDVYAIRAEFTHFHYSWYVVAQPSEERALRERVLKLRDSFDAHKFEEHEFVQDFTRREVFPTSSADEAVKPPSRAPAFRSLLIDASNTSLYRGWYTRSKVVLFERTTYLITTSTDGPTAAVFRPESDGSLTLLCSHRPLPSSTETYVATGTDAVCPISLAPLPIDWGKKAGDGSRTAVVDRPEWGGRRVVMEQLQVYGNEGVMRLRVGPVGSDSAEVNDLENFENFDASWTSPWSLSLRLTTAGPYVVVAYGERWHDDDPAPGDHYYRVVGNKLVWACDVTIVASSPPGYAHPDPY